MVLHSFAQLCGIVFLALGKTECLSSARFCCNCVWSARERNHCRTARFDDFLHAIDDYIPITGVITLGIIKNNRSKFALFTCNNIADGMHQSWLEAFAMHGHGCGCMCELHRRNSKKTLTDTNVDRVAWIPGLHGLVLEGLTSPGSRGQGGFLLAFNINSSSLTEAEAGQIVVYAINAQCIGQTVEIDIA